MCAAMRGGLSGDRDRVLPVMVVDELASGVPGTRRFATNTTCRTWVPWS